jgi:hypothetical protein
MMTVNKGYPLFIPKLWIFRTSQSVSRWISSTEVLVNAEQFFFVPAGESS